ncbi:MAG: tryptophan synthase subunit alpha [Nocardioidaceae bacterium]
MTSVRETIVAANAEGRAALIGYLPAGYPTVKQSVELIERMISCGVDVVEVGLPYSDPVMDGPTIQAAAVVALAGGTRILDVFHVVEASAAMAPTVVMTYWNPVERFGVDRFAGRLAEAGGAGLITPDLIPEEAEEWMASAKQHHLDAIFLVAPSSTHERLKLTADACRGCVYATAVMGVTGAREQTSAAAPELVQRVKQVTELPVGVGLGVSNGRQAAEVASYADAVIVGSAFVRCVTAAADHDAALASMEALTRDLAGGVRREL